MRRRTNSRFASALATRITASPWTFLHHLRPGPGALASDGRRRRSDPHSCPHGLDAAPRQAARRYRRRADDRPRACGARRRPASAPVVVATDSEAIAACVEKAGGRAVMTRADHVSGSDRIFEALRQRRPDRPRRHHRQCAGRPADASRRPTSRAALAAARRSRGRHRHAGGRDQPTRGAHRSQRGQGGRHAGRASAGCARSISPAPTAPAGDGPLYHHIGLYAYRRAALAPLRQPAALAARAARDSSSSCARSKPACASTSPSSTACRSASTPPADLARARGAAGRRR